MLSAARDTRDRHVSMKQPLSSTVALENRGTRDGVFTFAIVGRLDSGSAGKIWREANETVARAASKHIVLDASGIEYCDGSGIALLVQLRYRQQRAGGVFEIRGLRPEFQELLDVWGPQDLARLESPPVRRKHIVEEIGEAVVEVAKDTWVLVSFVGELALALVNAALHFRRVRWNDTFLIAESVGVNALPIVALIGSLMGLIMAFQAAVPLGRFGAQIYVANLIGLSILREMGPLMTAIVVAGRSGSAFAAGAPFSCGADGVCENSPARKPLSHARCSSVNGAVSGMCGMFVIAFTRLRCQSFPLARRNTCNSAGASADRIPRGSIDSSRRSASE